MGSEAPCCGGGLSGNYLLINSFDIHYFNFFNPRCRLLTAPKSNIFPFSSNFKHLFPPPSHPPKFYTSKTFKKLIQKFINSY